VEIPKPPVLPKPKEILAVSLVKEDKETGNCEFEVTDKEGNLALNKELVVKFSDNTTKKVITDENGRFNLTMKEGGFIYVDMQEYENYTVEKRAFLVEVEKPQDWTWLLILLAIPLILYLLLFMGKGKVEVIKERRDGKIIITVTNKTHKVLDACMLEDVIPLGLQVEPITAGLEKTATGDGLIINFGNLKKGEKRIAEYKIVNVEGIKGADAKELPEAKLVWSNGQQKSKNL